MIVSNIFSAIRVVAQPKVFGHTIRVVYCVQYAEKQKLLTTFVRRAIALQKLSPLKFIFRATKEKKDIGTRIFKS